MKKRKLSLQQKLGRRKSRVRSLLKTISWRTIAIVITSIVIWIITRELRFAIGIGIIDTLIKKMSTLLEENRELAKKQSLLKMHHGESEQQNKQAATKIKSIIDRLKTLEVSA